MQHLDHDMDDLLRKAAESYPLRLQEDDWDKLAAKMQFAPPVAETKPVKRSKYWFLLFVGVALCLILAGFYEYELTNREIKKATRIESIINEKETGIKKNDPGKKAALRSRSDNSSAEETKRVEVEVRPKTSIQIEKKVTTSIVANRTSVVATISLQKENGRPANNQLAMKKVVSEMARTLNTTDKEPKKKSRGLHRSQPIGSTGKTADGSFKLPEEQSEPDLNSSKVRRAAMSLQHFVNAPGQVLNPIKITSLQSRKQRGFYLGFDIGPEFSKVGSQRNTQVGYQGGFLIGYTINSKWSLESGVMIGKNNYYSNGSYFNMSKVASSMPTGLQILAVDGHQKRLEIPVIAKYNFAHRGSSKFFFTGGFLSDIYLQEKNYYQTMLNGVKDSQMGLYNQDQFVIASQLRFSVGYEHPLGRSGSFRLEPYKNIPLQRTGMGSMTVFSAGFNAGVVHFFGR